MKNFLLFKLGKICIYVGPYEMAFNDPEVDLCNVEDDEE